MLLKNREGSFALSAMAVTGVCMALGFAALALLSNGNKSAASAVARARVEELESWIRVAMADSSTCAESLYRVDDLGNEVNTFPAVLNNGYHPAPFEISIKSPRIRNAFGTLGGPHGGFVNFSSVKLTVEDAKPYGNPFRGGIGAPIYEFQYIIANIHIVAVGADRTSFGGSVDEYLPITMLFDPSTTDHKLHFCSVERDFSSYISAESNIVHSPGTGKRDVAGKTTLECVERGGQIKWSPESLAYRASPATAWPVYPKCIIPVNIDLPVQIKDDAFTILCPQDHYTWVGRVTSTTSFPKDEVGLSLWPIASSPYARGAWKGFDNHSVGSVICQ